MTRQEQQQKNCQTVATIGDLVETLFQEVSVLPLTDRAQACMVTVIVGNMLTVKEGVVTCHLPAEI
ncbi:MAG: hypothetical protein A2Y67_03745 [Candidatus Buchananbacteria bacterium RBG_13_39_9]|uniref:Uncharacterized protein n=1 Tax=Candidatus Buchananbacteria bacterium RBG_13_39_9 TaxID=1797531 RepID=A0A1G1XT73_9BACT|nr:MAG: hypothetical protein A2Y67_03745 [Candidatus Buchananbacteria bacterium RBG_13_39_9]